MKIFILLLSQKTFFRIKYSATTFIVHKYSFQRVPNRVDKLWKFQGMGGEGVWQATPGMEIPGVGGLKQKCPPWEVWIYFGTTPVRTYDKRRLTL